MSKPDKREEMKMRTLAQAQAIKAQSADVDLMKRFDSVEERMGPRPTAPVQPTDSPAQTSTKYIDPDEVKARAKSVRGISKDHVVDLMFSIAAVGCIHFPVVDESDTLLAGEHRLEAIKLLRELANASIADLTSRFEYLMQGEDGVTADDLMSITNGYSRHFPHGMPVHVMRTNGLADDDLRRSIEIVENEKRRDFSREDLMGIVTRLKEAGYTSKAGNPQPGQLNLNHEVGRIIGKSRATVFRTLAKLSNPEPTVTARTPPSKSGQDHARYASETLQTKVQIKESPKGDAAEAGTIVIHYLSFRHRAELLRTLGLKKEE
jgi:ParB family chromosome partitioning protein